MDIQKEREAFQECYKTSRDYKFYVRHEMSEKQIFEFKKGKYVVDCVNDAWKIWQAAKAQAVPDGFVVVPVELSESIAEKLALEKVEKPRQENDVVWQEIADRSYKDHLIQKKWEIIRNYKELVEAVRGGND